MKTGILRAFAAGTIFVRIFLTGEAFAEEEMRVWTDVNGRKIEARLLDVGINEIRVILKGKEVRIPFVKLSEADRKYAEEWKANGGEPGGSGDAEEPGDSEEAEKGGDTAKPGAGSASFGDKPLVTGGKVNVYEFDYDEETRSALVKNFKAEDTGYRIGVAAPVGFDPAKPQKVFIVMSPGNNAGQMTAGNIRSLGQFAQRGVDEGWVCIAYNSNLGLPTTHYAGYEQAVKKLLEIWPGMQGWTIATGGISGGAKGACINVNLLTARGLPVTGLFLQGCNSAENLSSTRDKFKVSKGDLRGVRCFVSTGKTDPLVSAGQVEGVIGTVKGEGIKTIRDERYDGGHDLNLDHLAMALEWFLASDP